MNGLARQLITKAYSLELGETRSAEIKTSRKAVTVARPFPWMELTEPRAAVTWRDVWVRNSTAEGTPPGPCKQVLEGRTQKAAFFWSSWGDSVRPGFETPSQTERLRHTPPPPPTLHPTPTDVNAAPLALGPVPTTLLLICCLVTSG